MQNDGGTSRAIPFAWRAVYVMVRWKTTIPWTSAYLSSTWSVGTHFAIQQKMYKKMPSTKWRPILIRPQRDNNTYYNVCGTRCDTPSLPPPSSPIFAGSATAQYHDADLYNGQCWRSLTSFFEPVHKHVLKSTTMMDILYEFEFEYMTPDISNLNVRNNQTLIHHKFPYKTYALH